ncbi:MAG TPA: ABC-2 family transporter protein [Anaerolineales bacterium]|nr:ABC-2 family transporter protein [Anaerolineales bacterium]
MQGFRLAFSYLRIGIMNEFQYRANLYIQILQTFIALATGLIGLNLVFAQTTNLGGWDKPELLAVMGVFTITGGVIRAAIQPNMERLMEEIREGTLDYALTKPADSQLLVSVREFRLWQLVDVITGIVVLIVALVQLHERMNAWSTLGFISALGMGAVMVYCFWLIITSSAFWIIRVQEIANLFEGLYAAGRWPVDIYPNWLRYGLTFLVPVAFAVTVPAEALTGRLTLQTWLGALALTALLFIVARVVWRIGLKNYSGASS